MFNFFIIAPQLKIFISNINYSHIYLEKYLFIVQGSRSKLPAYHPKINLDLNLDLDETGIQFNCLLVKDGANINYALR